MAAPLSTAIASARLWNLLSGLRTKFGNLGREVLEPFASRSGVEPDKRTQTNEQAGGQNAKNDPEQSTAPAGSLRKRAGIGHAPFLFGRLSGCGCF